MKYRPLNKKEQKIVQTFVECNLNIRKTAERLFIHPNTLRYNIRKIKKETGIDILNIKDILKLLGEYICREKD